VSAEAKLSANKHASKTTIDLPILLCYIGWDLFKGWLVSEYWDGWDGDFAHMGLIFYVKRF
jgi:hypothetical protein